MDMQDNVDHHHNELELKKSYSVILGGKISNSFFICYTSWLHDLFILLVVTFNLKAFHSSCDTKTFGAILLRGLL